MQRIGFLERFALLVGLVLLVLFTVPNALAGSGKFQGAHSYKTGLPGTSPYQAAIADFNRDGKADVVVAHSDGDLQLLLGRGDGSFEPYIDLGTGGWGVAAGDLNGDSKADLVLTLGGAVLVVLGNGDGTFQTPVPYPITGGMAWGIALGDFNGDGKIDVVATSGYSNAASVLLGNGDGTFQSHIEVPTADSPLGVTVGDFNNDGKLDFATICNGGVNVLLGNGDGTFQPYVNYGPNTGPYGVTSVDLNRDGNLDLVVTTGSDEIDVMLGNGDGTFRNPVPYLTGNPGNYPQVVEAADFNADGNPDLVTANAGDGSASVLLGNGDGTLQGAQNYPSGRESWGVTVGDINGDGAPDFVLVDEVNTSFRAFLNEGGVRIKLTSSANPSSVGQAVTFTANVRATLSSVGIPTGSVTFTDGTTVMGAVPLTSGQASFTTVGLKSGTHTIQALYSGDSLFNHSKRQLLQTVTP